MKFTNGSWLARKGVAAFSPVQVFEAEVLSDRVRLVVATHPIVDKGSTLQDAALFLEITAPVEGAIRIRAVHHKGRRDRGPHFALSETPGAFSAEETPGAIVVRSGSLALRVERDPWRLVFLRGNEELCASECGDLAYLRTDWTDHAYARDDGADAFFRERLSVAPGECFYGLGERFGALVRNGQTVTAI